MLKPDEILPDPGPAIPKTWKLLKAGDSHNEYEKPVGRKLAEWLDWRGANKAGINTFGGLPGRRFYWKKGAWWNSFKKKNPDYVKPPRAFVCIGPFPRPIVSPVMRVPGDMSWGLIKKALQAFLRPYDLTIRLRNPRDRDRLIQVEGVEPALWEKASVRPKPANPCFDLQNGVFVPAP